MGRRPNFTHLGQNRGRPGPSRRPRKARSSSPGYCPVPEAPAFAEEDRSDGLQVHLVRVGLAMLPAEGHPLLGKHTDEELLCEVACHESGPHLPLALASESRDGRRKDEGRSCSEDPVARVRRRQQLHESQIAKPGVPREFVGVRLVRDDAVEGHHRSRDQVPVFRQAHWHDRLEIAVVAPLAVVQLEVIELKRDGPDAAHRVG